MLFSSLEILSIRVCQACTVVPASTRAEALYVQPQFLYFCLVNYQPEFVSFVLDYSSGSFDSEHAQKSPSVT